MKKNVLLTLFFSILLNGFMFAQLSIQNGSFEEPTDDLKYKADGTGDGGAFNGNVPGWWADSNATDCGRQNSAKPAYDGNYTAYGFNNDGGSIWALAGTVEDQQRALDLTFYAWESFPKGQSGVSIAAIFATYEGSDTASFTVLDTLLAAFDPAQTDANGWQAFQFKYTLPESANGKKLLIGYDLVTESVDDSWYSFDDFELKTSAVISGIENNKADNENIKVFPNPASEFITIQGESRSWTTFSMYNIAGQEVLSGRLNQDKTIDVRTLNKGLYFLKVENAESSVVVKTLIK